MKRIFALVLSILLTASLIGCAQESGAYVPTGGALLMEDETQPVTEPVKDTAQYLELAYYPEDGLNPYTAANYSNRVLFSLIYQGLFSTDSSYASHPILCKNYTVSDDMRTYTFYLDAATFSDGSRVTVNDVLASYEAAKKGSVYSGRFNHISEISASQDGGNTFRVDTAMENLPILLDIPIVKADEVAALRPTGSGAYYYENASTGLRLRKRGDWWCKSDLIVSASSIPLSEVNSVLTLRDAFEFSNVGLACSDPCSDTFVEYRCDYELWDCDNGIFLYLGCNSQSKILSNTTLRAALTYAIDRQSFVDNYYRGFAQVATLPASPSSPYYSRKLAERYSFDKDKFAAAVSDTYMLGGEIKFIVNKDDTMRVRIARDIADTLRECGLKVDLQELSTKGYRDTLTYGVYDLYLGQTKLSPNMDLSPFFRTYGNLRYGGMTDSAIYALCQQALANSGNYYNLHETVMEDGRLVPVLFYRYNVHATRGLLTGLSPARDNIFFYTVGKTMADALVEN